MKALAEWHFGGGAEYCAACEGTCDECPYREHELETADGILAWEVIARSASQVRVGFGGPYALDFGAILALAEQMGALSTLLVDVLPSIEPVIIEAHKREGGDAS